MTINHRAKIIDKISRDGGFTLVELTVATTIFAFGMVALMGSLVEVTKYSNMTDARSTSNAAQQYVIDQLDGLTGSEILEFDMATLFIENEDGTFALGAMGDADVTLFAVLDEVNGVERIFEVGSDSPNGVVVPNPVEVRVVVSTSAEEYGEESKGYLATRGFNLTMSKLIAY